MTKEMGDIHTLRRMIRIAIREGRYSPKAIAAEFYSIPEEEVTPSQRGFIKTVAYPYIYSD